MSTLANPIKAEKIQLTPAENQKRVENHKATATHLEAAAKEHLDAAKHHENEEHEKAAKSTITAHGHLSLAQDAQREVLKSHALHTTKAK